MNIWEVKTDFNILQIFPIFNNDSVAADIITLSEELADQPPATRLLVGLANLWNKIAVNSTKSNAYFDEGGLNLFMNC